MPDDPRLTNQDSYLSVRPMRWSKWQPETPGDDHDHCAFCWGEFGHEVTDHSDFDAGWVTADDLPRQWVCPRCFEDFRARFAWTVVGERPTR